MTALLDHDRVVINQKAKLIELVNEYKIRDVEGNEVGVIRQEGQSKLKKFARMVTSLDQFMTIDLSVYDATGSKVLKLTRPRKFMKSQLLVEDGTGAPLGRIVQKNMVGKIRFGLEDAMGQEVGEIKAENWRAWNFAIVDRMGTEVGRITKTWEGLAKTMFTTADNYMVELGPGAFGALRPLAFAAAAAVDTAHKQDAPGLGYAPGHPREDRMSYPTDEARRRFDFVPYALPALSDDERRARGRAFAALMAGRRSVRQFSNRPVPRDLVELAVEAANTAPSGAHRQPWRFVLVGDAGLKREIRDAAEAEERTNYEGGRMPEDWQQALAPLGTGWEKPYLETAPWLVVVFEERYGVEADGSQRKNYYVKESVGISCGLFVAALQGMGLATLTHTPSPMAFLSRILERPRNERPFILFPVGYPADDCVVPVLDRKGLDDVLVERGSGSSPR